VSSTPSVFSQSSVLLTAWASADLAAVAAGGHRELPRAAVAECDVSEAAAAVLVPAGELRCRQDLGGGALHKWGRSTLLCTPNRTNTNLFNCGEEQCEAEQ
jgi:hypothetical protein